MFKTHVVTTKVTVPINESVTSRESIRTFKVSSVHDRRCKADDLEDAKLESHEASRVHSRDSRKSEIRSRISGKATAEAQKEREKAGPGDDHLIRMRVLNSYKQIKFSGIGVGANSQRGPTELPAVSEHYQAAMARKTVNQSNYWKKEDEVITRRDSIFPSDLDGGDQQT